VSGAFEAEVDAADPAEQRPDIHVASEPKYVGSMAYALSGAMTARGSSWCCERSPPQFQHLKPRNVSLLTFVA
jgi:hypothetical protein